jgi:uncharacterized protein (TIGR03086 family)
VDLTTGDWAAALEGHYDRLAAAWSDPAAWEGETSMAGPTVLPSALIGGMVLVELVVHTWDLARATAQSPQWSDDVVAFVHEEVVKTAEQGRAMGLYGPPVSVPAPASIMDRTLALTGREPAWTP